MNSPPTNPTSSKSRNWGVLAVLAIILGGGLVFALRLGFLPNDRVPNPKPSVAASPAKQPVANPYLGSQACVECHTERVAEYRTTKHYRTCRVPDVKSMSNILATNRGRFQTRNPNLWYQTYRDGDQLFQAAIRKTGMTEEKTVSRVDLILGAGDSDEVYLAWHDDGRMFELPMAWIESEKRWGAAAWWRNSQFDKGGPRDGARDLTLRCLECHSTSFEHVAGTLNQYHRQNHLLGVSCENCHGPAREHVALHRLHPEEKTPQAIIRPARLSRERQIEACTQCHSNAIKHRGPALQYRPGKTLDDFYKTVQTRTTEEDHVANQIHYLRQSKCFQQDATMTCVTCHNPHQTTGDDSPARIEKSCLNCHDRVDCGERPKLPTTIQDECIQCHLPPYLKINVNFQTEADDYVPPVRRHEHRIAVYPVARDEVVLNWHRKQTDESNRAAAARLEKSLAEHFTAEADKHRAKQHYLGEIAARREALRFDDSPAMRTKLHSAIATQNQIDADFAAAQSEIDAGHYDQAEQILRKLLAAKPDHAMAWGKLGTVLAVKKERERAFECLRKVSQLDPDLVYGESMLGWLCYLEGRHDEAVTYFRRANEIEPYNALINLRLGLALSKLGRFDEARQSLEQAVAIEPQNIEACRNLVAIFRQQEKPGDAVKYARQAAELTSQKDLEVLVELSETYAEAGQYAEAAEATSTAIELAVANKSQLTVALRKRLESYRAKAAK